MPIIANAKKALRQSKARANRNKVVRARVRSAVKSDDLTTIFSVVDKAVKRHLINKNKAARIKSRASIRLGKTQPADQKPVKKTVKKTVKKPVKKTTKKPAAKVLA